MTTLRSPVRSKLTPNAPAPARPKIEQPTRQTNFSPPQMTTDCVADGMMTLSPFYGVQSYVCLFLAGRARLRPV